MSSDFLGTTLLFVIVSKQQIVRVSIGLLDAFLIENGTKCQAADSLLPYHNINCPRLSVTYVNIRLHKRFVYLFVVVFEHELRIQKKLKKIPCAFVLLNICAGHFAVELKL